MSGFALVDGLSSSRIFLDREREIIFVPVLRSIFSIFCKLRTDTQFTQRNFLGGNCIGRILPRFS